ncbi:MAG: DUF3732 domain-containing protein [Bacteroidetes bacterium]|nr:DUF3732 domain-containing protein [Bacteroidota bacterium]
MNFYFTNILLWLKNGDLRNIELKNNKINIITGDSNTGKTTILQIIDYCLFSSKSKIPESIINENVNWYGVRININNKLYTIARKSLNKGNVSNEYYFSSTGEIPNKIVSNNDENAIKSILETEFSIDKNTVISFGSKSIKAGSKISLRYFLLFNTISVNIIENDSDIFFDKQNDSRYRDALPRIFDIAVGIETIENILKKEKKTELERKIATLKKKASYISQGVDTFINEKNRISKIAKEYSLIDSKLNTNDSIIELKNIISDFDKQLLSTSSTIEYENIEREINHKIRKIRNLEKFKKEYSTYKTSLKNIDDSLKPISFLIDNDSDILKTSIFEDLLNAYSEQLSIIRNSLKEKTPIDTQIDDMISDTQNEVKKLESDLDKLPAESRVFETEREKIFFLGEMKSKLELYSKKDIESSGAIQSEIMKLQTEIDEIIIDDTTKRKDLTIKHIEEIIADYIEYASKALENYGNYKPVFDYNEKSLKLRKPKTSHIEPVGSSSNHMFLHLFFSLAMHEIIFRNNSPFVAPFLIIDQPSRPYYGDDQHPKKDIDQSDEYKITEAFKLLNKFISDRYGNEGEFQMIIFEHVPKRIIENLDNVYIVEEFRNGNALILQH